MWHTQSRTQTQNDLITSLTHSLPPIETLKLTRALAHSLAQPVGLAQAQANQHYHSPTGLRKPTQWQRHSIALAQGHANKLYCKAPLSHRTLTNAHNHMQRITHKAYRDNTQRKRSIYKSHSQNTQTTRREYTDNRNDRKKPQRKLSGGRVGQGRSVRGHRGTLPCGLGARYPTEIGVCWVCIIALNFGVISSRICILIFFVDWGSWELKIQVVKTKLLSLFSKKKKIRI